MELDLRANPQSYDYLHKISLSNDGVCSFVDGGGQCIHLNIEGTYEVNYNENNKGGFFEFKFNEKEFDKHFKVNFEIEENDFIFVDEIVWKSKMEDWPISIYKKRYAFDIDPFCGLYKERQNNLYFILEGDKETHENIKYFYPDDNVLRKKMKDLTEEELNKIKEIDHKLYTAFIKNPSMTQDDLYVENDDE